MYCVNLTTQFKSHIMALSHTDYVKFNTLLEQTTETLKGLRTDRMIFNLGKQELIGMVETAKRMCKRNNSYDAQDALYCVNVLDTDTNELVWINVLPNKVYNTKNLFVFEVLKAQYATRQEFRYFKNLFK